MKRRIRSKRSQYGVTLIEVLIVVSIMAMISAGVAVAAHHFYVEAQIKDTGTNAKQLHTAIEGWRSLRNQTDCPTVERLRAERFVTDDSPEEDAWGTPWAIACDDHRVVVRSAGPDIAMGNGDDIAVPKGG